MTEIKGAASAKRAANIFKAMINNACEEGEEWFEIDYSEKPSLLDILLAIRLLDAEEDREFTITDIPETDEECEKLAREIE